MSAATVTRAVRIPVASGMLAGDLAMPPDARAVVLFAHGSGSSRLSGRNRKVAKALQDAGFATLLFDLLTEDEGAVDEVSGTYRFDIGLLTERLIDATHWTRRDADTSPLPYAYFGASTGAAASLAAAAQEQDVSAVISRGGRPDLAGEALPLVRAPTLLIVGGADPVVLDLNRRALAVLGSSDKDLVIVPGASHLFEEPGTLYEVVRFTIDWVRRHVEVRAAH